MSVLPVSAGPRSGRARVASTDATSLSERVVAMMVVRAVLVVLLLGLGLLWGRPTSGHGSGSGPEQPLLLATLYLAVSGLLGSAVLTGLRALAVRCFGASLLLDAAYLQYQHELLGHRLSVDLALAAYLVAVCLLASFRTGVKIAAWQSLLLLVALRGEQSGLFPQPSAMAGVDREHALATDTLLLWVVALTTAAAAAVNERELRRRRYDAEALAEFATRLHADTSPQAVAERLLAFMIGELDGIRGLVLRTGPHGIGLLAGQGVQDEVQLPVAGEFPDGEAAPSGLLSIAGRRPRATVVLRLDPDRDPWLDRLLPGARRLVALPVGSLGPDAVWLVFERGPGGGRIERRLISSADQAAATATLAMSRSDLLQRAERAAATDGLTGLANRRTLDSALAHCQRLWHERAVPYAVVLLDIDHFKQVNDRLGHQAGDVALQAVAAQLTGVTRPQDLATRYGGEEFCVLLPDADQRTAYRLAERIRRALHTVTEPVPLTASFGVAGVPENAVDVPTAVAAADAAMIEAKRTGRDKVVPAPRLDRDLSPAATPVVT
jgi:diguanylate cyclase (GGDEF)-like protein